MKTPPEGWYAMGTHVDKHVPVEFSEERDEAGMPLWERPVAILAVPCRDLKMLRENLCLAQHRIDSQWGRDRIGDLIAQIDVHRPLGNDCKHGDRHTDTCGCEDR